MSSLIASHLFKILCWRLENLIVGKKMRLILMKIETLLEDAEKLSEEKRTGKSIKWWLATVTYVVYLVDDLVDDLETFELQRSRWRKGFMSMSLFNPLSPITFSFKMVNTLQNMQGKLGELVEMCPAPISSDGSLSSSIKDGKAFDSRVPSVSVLNTPCVFGRDEDKENILNWLMKQESNENHPAFLSIIGMGGIGKTTLCQYIYNTDEVRNHFDKLIWVCLSEHHDLVYLMRSMLDSVSPGFVEHNDHSSLDSLVNNLRGSLQGKRYLLVLDDLWDDGFVTLPMLAQWLDIGDLTSRVLITTRNNDVAAMPSSVIDKYYLGTLSEEDSWSLLSHFAFGNSSAEKDISRFKTLGRQIATKCKGLPLALATIGRVLSGKRQESEWRFVLKADMGSLPEYHRYILPVLRLSYDRLPSHLKLCFAFCSVLPRGSLIDKDKLIWYWIANGFISPSETTTGGTLEDIGKCYFLDLVCRSFLTGIEADVNSQGSELYWMHDLIHDLALVVARGSSAVLESGHPPLFSTKLYHSSVRVTESSSILTPLYNEKDLRTLLLYGKCRKLPNALGRLKSLRVLNLSQTGLLELPEFISDMVHMRYLDLSSTSIKTLPGSIYKLNKLMHLELSNCYNLVKIPKYISKLTNLRHLGLQSCYQITQMPSGIGKLRHLQTLPTFVLSKADHCAVLSDLSALALRGRLEIKNLQFVSSLKEANLHEKSGLGSLGLSWGQPSDDETSVRVLETLTTPENLKVLDITGYSGVIFPALQGNFNRFLEKVSFIDCGFQELPPLGQLPFLKELHLKRLSEIEQLGNQFYGDDVTLTFPSLQRFELYDNPKLWEWRDFVEDKKNGMIERVESLKDPCIQAFPCLSTLSIRGCHKLTKLPSLPNLKELALSSCNIKLLDCVFHLKSVTYVVLSDLREIQSLPSNPEGLKSIKTLTVYDCDDLIHGLMITCTFSSLEHLKILRCDKLESLPKNFESLDSLQKLEIIDCLEFYCIPEIYPLAIQEFVIEGCPRLEVFPDSLKSLPSVPKFVIRRCPKLERRLGSQWSL